MLKKILNLSEHLTHSRLNEICAEYDAVVYARVRLADVLPIENSGISDSDYRFALQYHFDFIVASVDTTPLLAVEFDGPLHGTPTQKARDRIKNRLSERFELPLLRINSSFVIQKYRNMDLLGWIIQVWFLQKSFDEQQRKGYIPEEEIFDPFMIICNVGESERFPFWLSAPLLIKIRKLHETDRCLDFAPSHLHGFDDEGNHEVITWLRINNDSAIMTTVSMRKQNFNVLLFDLMSELAVYEIYEITKQVVTGDAKASPNIEVTAAIAAFKRKYKHASGCIVSGTLSSEDNI